MDAVGQGERRFLRHANGFGVTTAALSQLTRTDEDPLPQGPLRDARAQRIDDASQFIARHGGQRWHPLVCAFADQPVGATHPNGVSLDAHLPRPGFWHRHIDDAQRLRAAWGVNLYDPHVSADRRAR